MNFTSDDGRVMFDFSSGVACTNVGHNHPEGLRRMHAQTGVMVHAGHNIRVYPTNVEQAERLVELMS